MRMVGGEVKGLEGRARVERERNIGNIWTGIGSIGIEDGEGAPSDGGQGGRVWGVEGGREEYTGVMMGIMGGGI